MAVERDPPPPAVAAIPRRLRHLNLSFLRDRALQRILGACGHSLLPGLPRPGEGVAVWGASPTAWRGERLAARSGAPLVRIEDAFLRSLRPGRAGEAPLGLILDPLGIHFDPARPSLVESILATDPLDDAALLARARDGIARLRQLHLSKYNFHDPGLPVPAPGYVLVVDQVAGDASLCGAGQALFDEMLAAARAAHPQARIVIKTHPETALGHRRGHYGPRHAGDGVAVLGAPVSPWHLLEGAIAVHTVSSQMGFEAILAGHRPHVWGGPFYAGWGLSEDRAPFPRRGRRLTRAQLFAGVMLKATAWHDPCRNRPCSFEEAVDQLEAEVHALREDRHGHVAAGMRLWKRDRLQSFFGREKGLIFRDDPEQAERLARRRGRGLLVWAGRAPAGMAARRVEDGFLRSRGLGAELVPPLSLVTDDEGIYYDPARPSRLERLILSPLPPGGRARAERLVARLKAAGVTKYNLGGALPELPAGRRILVPGQVEDDASVLKGAGEIRTNLALLRAARATNPEAVILYKPHPDVVAGLRPGAIAPEIAAGLADVVLDGGDMAALLGAVDEVWTITSGTGFEALLRGCRVTTLGTPFYAGWGLTRDLGAIPARRLRRGDGSLQPRPDLLQLAHAVLIAYPRYWDPVARRPCPPEVALERLAAGEIPHPGRANRWLARLQGRLASHARLWRQ